jgi:hypothetical protein
VIAPPSRVARSLTERLYSATESDKTILALLKASPELAPVPVECAADPILTEAACLGLTAPKVGKPAHFGERRLSATDLADQFLVDCDVNFGEGLYRQGAGVVTHSAIASVLLSPEYEPGPDDEGDGQATARLELRHLWMVTCIADAAIFVTIRRRAAPFGWNVDVPDSMEQAALQDLQSLGPFIVPGTPPAAVAPAQGRPAGR